MNYINLMENIKNEINYKVYSILNNEFMNQFREEYQKIRPCKSTMQKAVEKYITKTATMRGEKTATYTQSTTVLMLGAEPETLENLPRREIVESATLEMLKNRRPADCYFMDSIALYKTLKKQEKRTYYLHINGYYYNAALIAEMIECIADRKETYIPCEICENGALFIRQTHAALILPVSKHAHHPGENINMQDFLKYCDSLEKSYIEEIKKTA